MSADTLQEYLALARRLAHIRWRHQGRESEEEDAVLDQMDPLWWAMSPEERTRAETQLATSPGSPWPGRGMVGRRWLVDRRPTAGPAGKPAGHRVYEEVA